MPDYSLDLIRFGSVWEDADVLSLALAPVARHHRLLSVGSAGDNALSLLTLDPSEVVVVDASRAQLACVELRMAAFASLEYEAVLRFVGVHQDKNRISTYRDLRCALTPGARTFWDARERIIHGGVIHSGNFEQYLQRFRRYILPLLHSRTDVYKLLAPRTREEREAFYKRHWNTLRWRTACRLFFSRTVMTALGRDSDTFAHVESPVGERLLGRAWDGLVLVPPHTNPYITYIFTGNYSVSALPCYLRRANFDLIRGRIGRLRIVHGKIDDSLGDTGFSGFNLSDIFEYMSPPEHEASYRAVVKRALRSARIVYWNLLVRRAIPSGEYERVRPLTEIADDLHCRDQMCTYESVHVDEVQ